MGPSRKTPATQFCPSWSQPRAHCLLVQRSSHSVQLPQSNSPCRGTGQPPRARKQLAPPRLLASGTRPDCKAALASAHRGSSLSSSAAAHPPPRRLPPTAPGPCSRSPPANMGDSSDIIMYRCIPWPTRRRAGLCRSLRPALRRALVPEIATALPPPASPPRSDRYSDDIYEYRHVILPKEIAANLPKDRLLSEVGAH